MIRDLSATITYFERSCFLIDKTHHSELVSCVVA